MSDQSTPTQTSGGDQSSTNVTSTPVPAQAAVAPAASNDGSTPSTTSTENAANQSSTASTSTSSAASSSISAPTAFPSPSIPLLSFGAALHPTLLTSINTLLFGSSPHADDVDRWHNQPFTFCSTSDNSSAPSYGLSQQNGGPCGVLASVQAFIIRQLAFIQKLVAPRSIHAIDDPDQPIRCTPQQATEALIASLTHIIQKATPTGYPYTIVFSPTLTKDNYRLYLCSSAAEITSFLSANLSQLRSPLGVVLFIYSVLLSRTLDTVKRDMDDSGLPLVARFGHSGQELVNLLLIGRAVTNLFDGNKELGVEDSAAGAAGQEESAFQLKGLTSRSEIGFLTVLEALRYSSVGENYKTPVYPIWVVGSSSHYTVLFAINSSITTISPHQQRNQRIRTLFTQFDPSENGFISTADLPALLTQLRDQLPLPHLSYYLGGGCTENEINKLADPDSMGIVLWQNMSVLIEHAELKAKESAEKGKDWSCGACTYLNESVKSSCEMCETNRPPISSTSNASGTNTTSGSGDSSSSSSVTNFSLYHFNGLEGGAKRARLARITVTDVDAGNGNGVVQERNDGGQGLREVIRTKWPSAIVQFVGTEPSIS